MCGIAAALDGSSPLDEWAGQAMANALRHRGPDGSGVRRMGPATLVHTRLAIIDVAGGDQPLFSEDGSCCAIVNGEIFNHLELRAELERAGHRFATRSDSEVIVHGYEEWGEDCVRRLNGMFAFILWDDRRQRLLAARDPFGVKPLYWCRRGGRLGLASEVGALLAAGLVEPAIDQIALDHMLAWRFVPAPRTIFDGVSKLAPASLLVAEGERVSVTSYREAPANPFEDASPSELAGELARRLSEAVGRQMMSDVPYGAFLSGGVDSAAIAAAMRQEVDQPPLTFTIGFPGHGEVLDERSAARGSAEAIGTEHHDTAMEELDFAEEMARCVRHLEEPCGSASAPAALQLSAFAARHVKVVLSGQGADEPLGGYERHQAAAVLALSERLPRVAGRLANGVAELIPRNERLKRAARLLPGELGIARLMGVFEITSPGLRAELTGGPAEEAAAERRRLVDGVLADLGGREDPLEQGLYLDTHLFLPDSLLTYGDKVSMAASLEQRVPFLDVELMRFVERIPARLRVKGLKRKWLYRRAMGELVPSAALERRKHPFATPYDDWLRASLGAEVERRFEPGGELSEVLAPAVVSRLVAEHRSGRSDHKRILYSLLELAHWHELFVQQRQEARVGA